MAIPPRRFKIISLIIGVVLSGLVLLSWTMPWLHIDLVPAEPAPAIVVNGEVAAPALAALGLAGLALVAALAIAGVLFRRVLGVLQCVLGGCVGWSALGPIVGPVSAAAPLVTETTGISGQESIVALVQAVEATAWPVITVVLGALMLLLGVFVTGTAGRWPAATSRYQATTYDDADAPRSAVSDWDSLSDGSDPTSR